MSSTVQVFFRFKNWILVYPKNDHFFHMEASYPMVKICTPHTNWPGSYMGCKISLSLMVLDLKKGPSKIFFSIVQSKIGYEPFWTAHGLCGQTQSSGSHFDSQLDHS